MAEFSTNALRNRAGPIERTPGGAGEKCDESCSCLDTVVRIEDDLCIAPETNPLWLTFGDVTSSVPIRDGGWWFLAGGNGGPLMTAPQCHSIPAASTGKKLRFKARVTRPILGITSVFIGLEVPGGSQRIDFRSTTGGGGIWFAVVLGSLTNIQVSTGRTAGIGCNNADLLEIEVDDSGATFFINGDQVAFIPFGAPQQVDLVPRIYAPRIGLSEGSPPRRVEVDYVCVTSIRSCKEEPPVTP
jgi:hypothetical protein